MGNLTQYGKQSSHKKYIPKPAASKKANLLANVWPPTWFSAGKSENEMQWIIQHVVVINVLNASLLEAQHNVSME